MKRLGDLEIYRCSLKLSEKAWHIYKKIPKEFRFEISSQFLSSVDSIGANIAEGYGRFHYKDSLKFYYNSRGSLWEAKYWLILIYKREFISKEEFDGFINELEVLGKKLNNFINRLKNAKK